MHDWTTRYFGPLYGRLYSRYLLAPERTQREVDFAQSTLQLDAKRVLDLAAGFGRHAKLLARRCRVVALDLNRDYLRMARRGLASRDRRNLHLLGGDMRRLPFHDASFDAVLLLFNSFGYFQPDRHAAAARGTDPNLRVLQEAARVTRPRGDLLIEVPNRAALLAAVTDEPRRHLITAEYEIEEEYTYDRKARALHNRTVFRAGRRREDVEYSLRLYDRAEMISLLKAARFRVMKCYGDYEGSSFAQRSSDLLLIHARNSLA
jgi:SAM-dependent methyltransferase